MKRSIASRFALKKKKKKSTSSLDGSRNPFCGCAISASAELQRCCSAYRKHFLWFVGAVLAEDSKHAKLFANSERAVAAPFLSEKVSLGLPAQELYARLYSRRRAWFFGPWAENASVFYDEVGSKPDIVERILIELENAAFSKVSQARALHSKAIQRMVLTRKMLLSSTLFARAGL